LQGLTGPDVDAAGAVDGISSIVAATRKPATDPGRPTEGQPLLLSLSIQEVSHALLTGL
jgi:hypothetical protein